MLSDQVISLDGSLKDRIRDRLSAFSTESVDAQGLKRAAVALTIVNVEASDEAAFLLTRRSKHLNRHGGQYALPGGRLDDGESAIEAALRELHEEIGILICETDVLGILDDYRTRSGFVITPVVVWAGSNTTIVPDPGEVAKVFRIPLTDLLSPRIPVLDSSGDKGRSVLSTPIATLGHQVFAPTAAFIFQFREVVLFDRPTRVGQFDQPKFAWK
ncbi:MAG: CoA pyrophosphatase [Acidiferrobacterales bacterium]|nr:CoA pyrophosphatase [Acidiferrobacterales bacterium]